MRVVLFIFSFSLLLGCAENGGDVESTRPPEDLGVTFYGNPANHPDSIWQIAKAITEIPHGLSVDEYQSALKKTNSVKIPFGHFKDYETFWIIHPLPQTDYSYVIAGGFLQFNDNLIYSTISVFKDGGAWRTIWSFKHDPDSQMEVRTRGLP